jgi:hypothetical protein
VFRCARVRNWVRPERAIGARGRCGRSSRGVARRSVRQARRPARVPGLTVIRFGRVSGQPGETGTKTPSPGEAPRRTPPHITCRNEPTKQTGDSARSTLNCRSVGVGHFGVRRMVRVRQEGSDPAPDSSAAFWRVDAKSGRPGPSLRQPPAFRLGRPGVVRMGGAHPAALDKRGQIGRWLNRWERGVEAPLLEASRLRPGPPPGRSQPLLPRH